jgi:hypothetical protein
MMISLLFDSNVWDEFHSDGLALLQLESLVSDGTVKVFTTSIQEQENSKAARKAELEHYKVRLRAQNIESEGLVVGFFRLDVDNLGPRESRWVVPSGSHNRDEVIAQTAAINNAWLVTQEKKRLRMLAIRNHLPVYNLVELLEKLSRIRSGL